MPSILIKNFALGASLALLVNTSTFAQLPQPDQAIAVAPQLADDTALICAAGGLIGAGGNGAGEAQANLVHLSRRTQRDVLVEFVSKVDINGDQQLQHDELQTLDFLSRQQLLAKFDDNLDRKLDAEEVQQALAEVESPPSSYPHSRQAQPEPTSQPEQYRNLRRFGIGLNQPPREQRTSPFARAATFGTTPGFPPPRQNSSIGSQRGGGRCQSTPTVRPLLVYWRVGAPTPSTSVSN